MATLATVLVAGCATRYPAEPYTLDTSTPGAELAFMVGESGTWSLSAVPPRAPYNQERPPSRLTAAWGTGTVASLVCGLGGVKAGYFSGVRGRLVCAIEQGGGQVRVGPVGEGVYDRVFDAVRGRDGLSVLANRYGGGLELINLSPDGGITGSARLPTQITADQAALLPSGRVAVLRSDPDTGACAWAVYAFQGGGRQEMAQTPADNCYSSHIGGRVLRDQVTGASYFLSDLLNSELVRLDETAGGLTLVPIDIRSLPLSARSSPRAPVIFDGALYFLAGHGEDRGLVIGRYDLRTGDHRRIAFPGPGPATEAETQTYIAALKAQPALNPSKPIPTVMGFMPPLAAGQPPRVVIEEPSGRTQVIPLDFADAIPVA